MTPHDETPQDPADRPADDERPREHGGTERPGEPDGEDAGTGDGGPRRLLRSRGDRVVGGVASGVARYFDIDPVIVRVAFVALAFIGGAGILLYLAALLLVPDERGHVAADASSFRGKLLIVVAGVLLFVATASAIPWGWGDWFLGGLLFPLAFLALLGLGAWWLFQGRDPGGDAGGVLRAIVLGSLLLAGCAVLALGAAWATAVGGGEVVAGLVVVAGVMLAAGAFVARVRWLILPTLAIALPLALVSAAGIDVDDSVGEREYRPLAAADVRDGYELGLGSLLVDLRDADLGPGEHHLDLKVGVGEAVLLVPEDVCVASAAQVGLGGVEVFDRDSHGVDVDWDDRRAPPPGTPTVVVDAEVGIGRFAVDHEWRRGGRRGFGPRHHDDFTGAGFSACRDDA